MKWSSEFNGDPAAGQQVPHTACFILVSLLFFREGHLLNLEGTGGYKTKACALLR